MTRNVAEGLCCSDSLRASSPSATSRASAACSLRAPSRCRCGGLRTGTRGQCVGAEVTVGRPGREADAPGLNPQGLGARKARGRGVSVEAPCKGCSWTSRKPWQSKGLAMVVPLTDAAASKRMNRSGAGDRRGPLISPVDGWYP